MDESRRTQLDGIVAEMTKNGESDKNIQLVVEDFKTKYSATTNKKSEPKQSFMGSVLRGPVAAATRVGNLIGYGGIKGVAALTGNKELSRKADLALDDVTSNTQSIKAPIFGNFNTAPIGQDVGKAARQSGAEGIDTILLGVGNAKVVGGASKLARATNYAANIGLGYTGDVASNVIEGKDKISTPGVGTAIAAASPVLGKVADVAIDAYKGSSGGLKKLAGATKSLLTDSAETLAAKKSKRLINKLASTTAGDAMKVASDKQYVQNGIDILRDQLDSGKIDLPSLNQSGTLGSDIVKEAYKGGKLTGDEFIHTVNQASKNLVSVARGAVEEASTLGLKVDTAPVINKLENIVKSATSTAQKNAAREMLNVLKGYDGDPVKVFDWIQEANNNFGSDAVKHKVANQAADVLREAMDQITDRKAYGDSYKSMMALKRLVAAAAKKANKKLDYLDIGSDVAVDAFFASQLANPFPGANFLVRNTVGKVIKGIGNGRDLERLNELLELSRTSKNIPVAPTGKVVFPESRQLPAGSGQTPSITADEISITKPNADFVSDSFGQTVPAQKGLKTDIVGALIEPGAVKQKDLVEYVNNSNFRFSNLRDDKERALITELSEKIKALPSYDEVIQKPATKLLGGPTKPLELPSRPRNIQEAVRDGNETLIVDAQGNVDLPNKYRETVQSILQRTGKKLEDFGVSPQGKLLLSSAGVFALLQASQTEAASKDPEYRNYSVKKHQENPVMPGTDGKVREIGKKDMELIEKAIAQYKKIFPEDKERYGMTITPREIAAMYNKESSAGSDSQNADPKEGYRWLTGIEKDTVDDILKSTKARNKKIAPYLKDIDTPEKAFVASVLLWRMKKIATEEEKKDGKLTGNLVFKGVRTPEETYEEYNGGGNKNAKAEYREIIKHL